VNLSVAVKTSMIWLNNGTKKWHLMLPQLAFTISGLEQGG